ncbi:hypothetical protein ACBI99_18445 [Nonomuraea sp. ATR24]|uniref:hypothetical protein n=1 Tax=Nonomuraea sp. ATR24 TaxID=1676744 RepID=UPI0035C1D04E
MTFVSPGNRTLLDRSHDGDVGARWNLIRYDGTGKHLLLAGNAEPLSRVDDGRITPLIRPASPGALGFLPEIHAAW